MTTITAERQPGLSLARLATAFDAPPSGGA